MAETKKSRGFDAKLHKVAREDEELLKLLFLGAGESGKSTLFKQMRVIHGEGYSEEDRKAWREAIFSNIAESMNTLIEQTTDNYGGFTSVESKTAAEAIKQLDWKAEGLKIGFEEAKHFQTLLADSNLQTALDNRTIFHLSQGAPYFFQHLDRLCDPECIPSVDDILRTRVRTTGIIQDNFLIEGHNFQMYDLGGQRTERKKWLKCFDCVTAVVWVAAASGFNEVLFEDDKTNKLEESLMLFQQITKSRHFQDTAIILFLNKDDVFRHKLDNGASITSCFAEYKGANTYEESMAYIQAAFRKRTQKEIQIHCTTATSSNNIRFVFDSVKEIVISEALDLLV